MILCCASFEISLTVSEIADISSIIIAVVNLVLAFYIFVYQRRKDIHDNFNLQDRESKSRIEALSIQEQNIRLQWFKELIIQPHIDEIKTYYRNVYSIENRFSGKTISDQDKIDTADFIKSESAILRKSFYDLLRVIDVEIHLKVKDNIDALTDRITEKIFDPGLNLNDKPTFEREIGKFISYSHNELIGLIYSFKGN